MYKKVSKIGYVVVVLLALAAFISACSSGAKTVQGGSPSEVPGETVEEVKPSNPGGPGDAINLTGDVTRGSAIFVQRCKECHGDEGKVGIANPGSSDGSIPSLNPIDPGLVSSDLKVFATNIDLFIEHGSTPEGSNPAKIMTAFGDQKIMTAQEIADVIAYVISLNTK